MRNIIALVLLSLTINCQAADMNDLSVWDAMMIVQKKRIEMLEKQMEEQMRAAGMLRPR